MIRDGFTWNQRFVSRRCCFTWNMCKQHNAAAQQTGAHERIPALFPAFP